MSNIRNFEKHFGFIFCSFWGIMIALCACTNPTTSIKPDTHIENTSHAITSPTAPEFALKFINAYVNNCNQLKHAEDCVTWIDKNHFTSQDFNMALKNLIEKANQNDPELGLGFDPIFNAQDYPEAGFELDQLDSMSNTVVVKGKNMPSFKMSIHLISRNNRWLINGCGAVNVPQNSKN